MFNMYSHFEGRISGKITDNDREYHSRYLVKETVDLFEEDDIMQNSANGKQTTLLNTLSISAKYKIFSDSVICCEIIILGKIPAYVISENSGWV